MDFGVVLLIATLIGSCIGAYIRWRMSVWRQWTVPGAKSTAAWRKRTVDRQHAEHRQHLEVQHRQAQEEMSRLFEEAKNRIQSNM